MARMQQTGATILRLADISGEQASSITRATFAQGDGAYGLFERGEMVGGTGIEPVTPPV